ncbi:unnamed protein product [Sphagnum balticum]
MDPDGRFVAASGLGTSQSVAGRRFSGNCSSGVIFNSSVIFYMMIKRVVSKYELGEVIGRGAYSEVYRARNI